VTEIENRWDALYQAKDETGVSWFQERPQQSLDLIARSGIAKSDAIVDAGAGASRLAEYLLQEGYSDLTLLDMSATALQKAKARLPQDAPVQCVIADIRHWVPARIYRLWHDRAAFHFLTDPEDRRAYLSVVQSALAPGGFAVVGTFAPDGPEKCSGLPIVQYDGPRLAATFGAAFRLIHSETSDHSTPSGGQQRFHFGILQKK
tara:strand:+ start:544 stop:1155 length:612 start_codon:yes stop_codon:yes gene_type:complete